MPNIVRVSVENADELLNASAYDAGALVRLQSSTTEAGAYSNVATASLVAGTRIHVLYDANGTGSTWYRTRYENAGGTRTSDWSAVFQAGGEEGGLLCSLYDVKQRLGIAYTDASEDENILEYIRQASAFIETETERWLSPRPASGTTTFLFSPTVTGRDLPVPKGIRSVSAIGYATDDQPDTGGTFTAMTASDALLVPGPIDRTPGWPATGIRLRYGSGQTFWSGTNTVTVTGTFGWASVPHDVAAAAADLAVVMHRGRADGGIGGVVTVNVDGSRTFERLPTSVHRVLTAYRTRFS